VFLLAFSIIFWVVLPSKILNAAVLGDEVPSLTAYKINRHSFAGKFITNSAVFLAQSKI